MERFNKGFEAKQAHFDGDIATEERYNLAYKRVKRIKQFYVHLLVYVLVNLFTVGEKFIDQGVGAFHDWSIFSTPFFWGIGVIAHAFSVFGKDVLFGDNWEQRKIQEFMDKEKTKESKWE